MQLRLLLLIASVFLSLVDASFFENLAYSVTDTLGIDTGCRGAGNSCAYNDECCGMLNCRVAPNENKYGLLANDNEKTCLINAMEFNDARWYCYSEMKEGTGEVTRSTLWDCKKRFKGTGHDFIFYVYGATNEVSHCQQAKDYAPATQNEAWLTCVEKTDPKTECVDGMADGKNTYIGNKYFNWCEEEAKKKWVSFAFSGYTCNLYESRIKVHDVFPSSKKGDWKTCTPRRDYVPPKTPKPTKAPEEYKCDFGYISSGTGPTYRMSNLQACKDKFSGTKKSFVYYSGSGHCQETKAKDVSVNTAWTLCRPTQTEEAFETQVLYTEPAKPSVALEENLVLYGFAFIGLTALVKGAYDATQKKTNGETIELANNEM